MMEPGMTSMLVQRCAWRDPLSSSHHVSPPLVSTCNPVGGNASYDARLTA